ncbi:MAG TPA: TenA family protein [Acidimicrobiales bacterium]|jgi:thiaminase/transcriptional activator TenA|nr:TenA family protein [Acidimicrobiales bacterium]
MSTPLPPTGFTPGAAGTDGFCTTAWWRTVELRRAIRDHPFNEELSAGILDMERFAFYLVQDARYLVSFARALATASARAADPADAAFFAASANTALTVEAGLHARYLSRFRLDGARAEGIATSPSCLAYASYLQAAALSEPYPVLVAALLPCFWVYHDVASGIVARFGAGVDHPYGDWIATYADEGFAASVSAIRDIADRAAEGTDAVTRRRMLAAFTRATEYEWMFWQSAWEREGWPTARWVQTDSITQANLAAGDPGAGS